MVKPDFYVYFKKFQIESEKATDWLIRSGKFKHGSIDRQIAILFHDKYWQIAIDHLRVVNKSAGRKVTW